MPRMSAVLAVGVCARATAVEVALSAPARSGGHGPTANRQRSGDP